jgi:hypothetical protein
MNRLLSALLLTSFILFSLLPSAVPAAAAPALPSENPPIPFDTSAAVQTARALDELPLYFIANAGQEDERASFTLQGRDRSVYFTPQGLTFSLTTTTTPERPGLPASIARYLPAPAGLRWNVGLDFVGADPLAAPVGESPTQAVISYFHGSPKQWQSGMPTFSQVRYPELWPGIDLVYSGRTGALKYEFLVQPGADPAQIRLAYRGAGRVRLTETGGLEVSTPAGSFDDAAPQAYQVRDGLTVPVDAAISLGDGSQGHTSYGFTLGAYDPSLPLVIDPEIVMFAGFIGGSGYDYGEDIALDAAGNIYIAGTTTSDQATFPTAVGPDLTHNGEYYLDAFVAKLNPGGTALLYAGYIGGASNDEAFSIAVDAQGSAYIAGGTDSSEATFPVITGPDLIHNGSRDGFIVKVNPSGTALVYAGYIGGDDFDEAKAVAVDSEGSAYVVGVAQSDHTTFPVKVGPDLTHNGGGDAFVAKVSQSGASLVYSGFIGGTGYDPANAVAVDSQGKAYLAGHTTSDQYSFPVKVGPDLTFSPGRDGYGNPYPDAFVARVNAAGSGLDYAGYIGGLKNDSGRGIALSPDGSATVAGSTTSDEASFPVKVGPGLVYQGQYSGFWLDAGDAFVARVSPTGEGLVFAGYIGGARDDYAEDVALDAAGNVYIVGTTNSDQTTFPVMGGPDLTFNLHPGGNQTNMDAFVAMVNTSGSALRYAGYVGGGFSDKGSGIAVDAGGNAFITGSASSTQSSFPVLGGPDLTHNGQTDAFVAKIGPPSSGPFDLAVSRVEVIQGTTMSPPFRVHIANRPTLVRAFVSLGNAAVAQGVRGRLTRYVNGTAQDSLDTGPIQVTYITDEGSLQATLNFTLPPSWLAPGTAYRLVLDPANAIPETDENNNAYPASGSQSFNFVNAPVLNIVLVPVIYAPMGQPTTTPDLSNLDYLTWMIQQVYPAAQINFSVRAASHTFTTALGYDQSAWSKLLTEIRAIHDAEDPGQRKIYYGVVNSGCPGGYCLTGLAYLNANTPNRTLLKSAVGWTGTPNGSDEAGDTLAHEIAHIYGRYHVLGCGITFNTDPNYPYGDKGLLGQWGYNTLTGELFDPTVYADYMSYCNQKWTSDYTYYGLYQAFRWVDGWKIDMPYRSFLPSIMDASSLAPSAAAASPSRSLVLSGIIAPDGSLQVSPLFPGSRAPDSTVPESPYQAVLLDASGEELGRYPLPLTEVAFEQPGSGEMGLGFYTHLPTLEGLAKIQIFTNNTLVFERASAGGLLSLGKLTRSPSVGGAQRLALNAPEGVGLTYRLLFSPDGGITWQVLALDTPQPMAELPPTLLEGAPHPVLRLQVSDGVQTSEQVYDLSQQ